MFADTMFISAIEDFPGRRAQYMALSFSGNSDRNGATHWMNRYSDTPKYTANRSMLRRNGAAATYRMRPPPANSRVIARICPRRDRLMMRRGIASMSSIASDSRGGTLLSTQRYTKYISV